MEAEKVLVWLRTQLPEACLKFKGLRYQPKGQVSMQIRKETTRASAWYDLNLITWGRNYLKKAPSWELEDTLIHELIHLALPSSARGHHKLFLKYCEILGCSRYSQIKLRNSPQWFTIREFSRKVDAKTYKKKQVEMQRGIGSTRCFRIMGKRGDWKVQMQGKRMKEILSKTIKGDAKNV